MQTPEMKRYAGTGDSTLLITRQPVSDTGRHHATDLIALFEGADLNSSHIPAERLEGIFQIVERSAEHRDHEGFPAFLYDFTFHNVTLQRIEDGISVYTGWLTSPLL